MTLEKEKMLELGLRSGKDQISKKGDNYIKVYANNVQMAVSLWDMNLVFGEIIGEEIGQPVVEQKVKVNMSKEFAKALSNLLVTNITDYEEKFGTIKLLNKLAEELKDTNSKGSKKPTRQRKAKTS